MEKIDFVNLTQPAINDSNLNRMQDNIERAINAQVSGDTLPLGAIIPFPGGTIPENYLLCDGSAVSRTTYSLLFNVIGTIYGAGDGSTTFNLPDMRGRVPVGVNSNDTDFNAVGKTFGEKSHTLTISEMPNHTHTPPENLPVVLHKKTESVAPTSWTTSGTGQDLLYDDASLTGMATGGGQAHNITQPSMATNYIIKAFQSAGVVAQVNNQYSTSTTNVYSASYVNNIADYSTTEKVCGTWMGKPLYRKTLVSVGSTGDNVGLAHGIPTIGAVIRSDIFGTNNAGRTYPAHNGIFNLYVKTIDTTNVWCNISSGFADTTWKVYVTIEYTKATD